MPLRDAVSEKSEQWTTARKICVGCGCGCLVLLAVMLIVAALIASVVLDKSPVIPATGLLTSPAMGMLSARIDGNDPATDDLLEYFIDRVRSAKLEGLPQETQNAVKSIRTDQFKQIVRMLSPVQVVFFVGRPEKKQADKKGAPGAEKVPVSLVVSMGRGGFLLPWLVGNQMETLLVSKKAVAKNCKGVTYCVITPDAGGDGTTLSVIENNLIIGAGVEVTEQLITKFKEKEHTPSGRAELMAALNELNADAEIFILLSNNDNLLKKEFDALAENIPEMAFFMQKQEGQARSAFDQAALKALGMSIDVQGGNTANVVLAAPSHNAQAAADVIAKAIEKVGEKHSVKLLSPPAASNGVATARIEIGDFISFAEAAWQALQPAEKGTGGGEQASEAEGRGEEKENQKGGQEQRGGRSGQ